MRKSYQFLSLDSELIDLQQMPFFIDLKAGYDWLNREMLFKILKIRTESPVLVKILKALYTGTSAAIKGSKQFFQVFSGCRQGGIESPVIFNIYLDFVLRRAEHEIHFRSIFQTR